MRSWVNPELEHDERFAQADRRAVNQLEVKAIIEAWLAGFRDNAAELAHLELRRAPAAPVLNPIEALAAPYFLEREMVRFIEDPVLGPLAIPGFPLRFSAQPERPELVAPLLGEHHGAVLARLLDYGMLR